MKDKLIWITVETWTTLSFCLWSKLANVICRAKVNQNVTFSEKNLVLLLIKITERIIQTKVRSISSHIIVSWFYRINRRRWKTPNWRRRFTPLFGIIWVPWSMTESNPVEEAWPSPLTIYLSLPKVLDKNVIYIFNNFSQEFRGTHSWSIR